MTGGGMIAALVLYRTSWMFDRLTPPLLVHQAFEGWHIVKWGGLRQSMLWELRILRFVLTPDAEKFTPLITGRRPDGLPGRLLAVVG